MSSHNSYVLTKPIRKQLEKKGLCFTCCRCGKPLKEGEPVVSKISSGRVKRFFCRSCWDEMFM